MRLERIRESVADSNAIPVLTDLTQTFPRNPLLRVEITKRRRRLRLYGSELKLRAGVA